MAIPVPYFGYTKNGLEVTFSNLSLENPTNYQWGFGDGGSSTSKNPTHIYSAPGFYQVTLVVGNTDGNSDPLEIIIGVGEGEELANRSLPELIDEYIPSELHGSASMAKKVILINKWQTYLQPLVYLETGEGSTRKIWEINKEDTHNEFAWPGLINYLIAQLVAYDIIMQGANAFLANIGKKGSEQTTTTGTGPKGGIKSIETGPAKTEWYDEKDDEEMEKIGKVYANATRDGGILEHLKESLCQLSSRVRIYLPMCGHLAHNTNAPQVVRKGNKARHNANPFGITKRML